MSHGVWDHAMLLATRHKRTQPVLIQTSMADTRFNYPGRMESWVYLGDMITARPTVKHVTTSSKVRHPNSCATKKPSFPEKHCAQGHNRIKLDDGIGVATPKCSWKTWVSWHRALPCSNPMNYHPWRQDYWWSQPLMTNLEHQSSCTSGVPMRATGCGKKNQRQREKN